MMTSVGDLCGLGDIPDVENAHFVNVNAEANPR